MTLIPWAVIVAIAAPDAPILKITTKIKSPIILKKHAIATVISGVLESPIPLKTAPITL